VPAWLVKHPRFQLHVTPASSSWLNLVEQWLRELTSKAPRTGVFHSVADLIASIEGYIKVHNNEPKPLAWPATAESILTKVRAAESPSTKQSANSDTQHEMSAEFGPGRFGCNP